MRGRKQKAGDECEMIDEEAELGLACGPPRGSVERETEEDHISRGQERGFGKIGAGHEARDQGELEQGREPGQELRQGEAGRRDVGLGRRGRCDFAKTAQNKEGCYHEAAEGRGIDLAKHSARGRDGLTGARKPGDIGFASLRGGTVVGEHSVIFAGPAERVELTHRAEDRLIFARGALHAALWARGKKPGLYSMADVLGLSDV